MPEHAGQLSRSIAARIVTSSNSRDNSNFHPAAGTALPQASGTSFTQLTAKSGGRTARAEIALDRRNEQWHRAEYNEHQVAGQP